MRFFKHSWIAVVVCGLVSGGTFLAPWGLASVVGWMDRPVSIAVDEEGPREAVYWAPAEPEVEWVAPEPVEITPEVAPEPAPDPAPVDEAPLDQTLVVAVGSPEVTADAQPDGRVAEVRRRRRSVTDVARARKARRARRARQRRRARCKVDHPSVRVGPDGVVEVDKAYVKAVTKNLKAFMELGYSRPHDEDGVKGWYISGFGCTSPVHKAGFRRRDILLRVNGRKTRSWAGVFLLYQKLKRKSDFQVELMRGGESTVLEFRIVKDWVVEG